MRLAPGAAWANTAEGKGGWSQLPRNQNPNNLTRPCGQMYVWAGNSQKEPSSGERGKGPSLSGDPFPTLRGHPP